MIKREKESQKAKATDWEREIRNKKWKENNKETEKQIEKRRSENGHTLREREIK